MPRRSSTRCPGPARAPPAPRTTRATRGCRAPEPALDLTAPVRGATAVEGEIMPENVFPLDSTRALHRPEDPGTQPLAPRHPTRGQRAPRGHLPRRLPRVVRRLHHRTTTPPRTSRPLRCTRCTPSPGRSASRARSPAICWSWTSSTSARSRRRTPAPLAGQGWGYTGIFAKRNGGSFLTDEFPDAYKAVWDFRGDRTTSRHVPGVEFTGMIHPGLMGTAPSPKLLTTWNTREGRAHRHRSGPRPRPRPAARAGRRDPRRSQRGGP